MEGFERARNHFKTIGIYLKIYVQVIISVMLHFLSPDNTVCPFTQNTNFISDRKEENRKEVLQNRGLSIKVNNLFGPDSKR